MADAGVLRLLIAGLLALAAAFWVDRRTEALGVLPPGFREPWRRIGGLVVVASILFLGVFLSIAMFGVEKPALTVEDVSGPGIFLLQGLLVLSLVTWFVLGYAGVPDLRLGATFARQFGLRAEEPWKELGLGVLLGFAGWALVIALMLAVAGIFYAVGGEEVLPQAPPDMVPLVAGLPLLIRLAIGMTAGIVEETFFRGFLQPRIGIALSTIFFVMAHLSYDAPFMLVGITALSLLYAFVVRWRRNVLAAIVAHATFDLIQLLFVVPTVLRMLPEAAG